MTHPPSVSCERPIPLEQLIDYSLMDLQDPEAQQLEEHLFECQPCAARLEKLVLLKSAISQTVSTGQVAAAVTGRLLNRASGQGLQVRQYRLGPGGRVECTAAPGDDFVAVRLGGGFQNLKAVNIAIDVRNLTTGEQASHQLADVPVDRASGSAGEAVLLFPGETVRGYPRSLWTIRIHDAAKAGPPLGVYTMDHTPWNPGMR